VQVPYAGARLARGEVVIHDTADFMKRGGLKQDLRLAFEKMGGRIDDEGFVAHLLVANHFRKDVTDRRVVSGDCGIIHNAQVGFVAGAQANHRFADFVLIEVDFLVEAPLGDGMRERVQTPHNRVEVTLDRAL
jgi:hypothetical protein